MRRETTTKESLREELYYAVPLLIPYGGVAAVFGCTALCAISPTAGFLAAVAILSAIVGLCLWLFSEEPRP